MELKTVAKIPRFRGLIADDDGAIIGFRGRQMIRLRPPFRSAEPLGVLPNSLRQACARNPFVRRFLRQEVYHMVVTPVGTYLCTAPLGIMRKGAEDKEFRLAFRDFRGKRPLSLCVDGDGRIYFGEYFLNFKRRHPVNVFVSEDDGRRWRTCYRFQPGAIRHIHGLFWDSIREKIWVFTGDKGREVQIGCATPNFTDYKAVSQEGQLSRACSAVVARERLIFATDTPIEKNFACSLDPQTGQIRRHAELQHSVFFMAKALGGILLSTVVEPSTANATSRVHIWFSQQGDNWSEVLSYPRDRLHLKLFQYPTAYIAPGGDHSEYAFLSLRAVGGHDGACLVVSRA